MVPLQPNWREVVTELHKRYGTYHAILDALGCDGVTPCDHTQLSRLQSGVTLEPKWQLGAALLNLYAKTIG